MSVIPVIDGVTMTAGPNTQNEWIHESSPQPDHEPGPRASVVLVRQVRTQSVIVCDLLFNMVRY